MRRFAIFLLFGLAACGKQADPAAPPEVAKSAARPAAQPAPGAMPAAMEKMIPVPKDKAQLNRMLAMGYTVHEDHMHPPGVKECAFDKAGGSVIQ
jgi:hypothetical protein